MRTRLLICGLILLAGLSATTARAEIVLAKVLGDNMVLQRSMQVPIWGTAAADEAVTVKFAGQEKSTKADASGKWQLKLDAMAASVNPADLVVSGTNSITLKNILIGEVWFCGGQSNMDFPMRGGNDMQVTPPMAQAAAEANFPNIRLFHVAKNERAFVTEGWQACSPETVAGFSAVGFFFGRELQKELNVPIGLIHCAWGGSHIERWTPAEAYEKSPIFASAATSKPVRIDNQRAGQYFDPMVRPLIPYAIRGGIWYQGESNIINSNDGMRYFDKFKVMLDSYRSIWGQGDFSFYSVEIAPYYYTRRNDPLKHSAEELPLLWEAQVECLKLPNTGLAATTDLVENFAGIHPPNKWEVGRRLALIAMAKDYGKKDLEYSGPMYKSVEFKDAKAIVRFDHANGLAAKDAKPLTEFTIAGADGKFFPATAVVAGDTVVVSSDAIKDPKTVRLGWHELAQPNLINKAGLPVIPFRTDKPGAR